MVRPTPMRVPVAPLPATVQELDALRPDRRTIYDYAQDVFMLLYEDETFQGLIGVTENSEAQEGNIRANYYKAVMMMQVKAKALNLHHPVANANWGTLHSALKRVLTRRGISVKQRRKAAYVPPTSE